MKKFNIRKVLDGLTAASSSSSSSTAQPGAARENDAVQETLQSEHFQLCKVGFVPFKAADTRRPSVPAEWRSDRWQRRDRRTDACVVFIQPRASLGWKLTQHVEQTGKRKGIKKKMSTLVVIVATHTDSDFEYPDLSQQRGCLRCTESLPRVTVDRCKWSARSQRSCRVTKNWIKSCMFTFRFTFCCAPFKTKNNAHCRRLLSAAVWASKDDLELEAKSIRDEIHGSRSVLNAFVG